MSPTQIPLPGSFSLGPAVNMPAGLVVGFPVFTNALFDAQAAIAETGAEPDEALPVAVFSKNPQQGQTGQPKQEQPQLWSTGLQDFHMRVEVTAPEALAEEPTDLVEVSGEAQPAIAIEAEPTVTGAVPPQPAVVTASPALDATPVPEAAEPVAKPPVSAPVTTTPRTPRKPSQAEPETVKPAAVPSVPVLTVPVPAVPVSTEIAPAAAPKADAAPEPKPETEVPSAIWTPSVAAESLAPLRTLIAAPMPGKEFQRQLEEPALAGEPVKDLPPTLGEAVEAATRGIAPIRTVRADSPASSSTVLPAIAGREIEGAKPVQPLAPSRAPLAVAMKVKSATPKTWEKASVPSEPSKGAEGWTSLETRPAKTETAAAPTTAPKASVIKAIEPVEPEVAPKKLEPLKEISLRIGEKQEVQLRVVERGGELHVAVRTGNSTISQDLREELPELVRRIEQQGYRTEAWRPGGTVSGVASASEAGSTEFRQGQPDPQQQQQQQQGSSQQHSNPQQQNHANRPKWVEELENGLTREEQPLTGESNGVKR